MAGSHWNQQFLRKGPLDLLVGGARPVRDDKDLGTRLQGAAYQASSLEALRGRVPSAEGDPKMGFVRVITERH